MKMNRREFTMLVAGGTAGWAVTDSFGAPQKSSDPNRIIQYRGQVPLVPKALFGKSVELSFELFRSPSGGASFWSETREVAVASDGIVQVDIGQLNALPDEVFKSPFCFLSVLYKEAEIPPRKQVACLVYVASEYENGLSRENYIERALENAKAAARKAPSREDKLDTLVDCGAFHMEKHPRMPVSWLEAEATAKKLGARLPTFEQWYAAHDSEAVKQLVGMSGHYEWVVPWVYDPVIHARMGELYRGKPVACYYNELSPMNGYPFRLVKRAPDDK